MGTFDDILRHLDDLPRRQIAGAVEGARVGAQTLQDAARETGTYQNQSGATRAGTVAYVVGGGYDGSGLLHQAVAAAEQLNPGQTETHTAGTVGPDEIVVILTAATTYAGVLETRFAGQQAFIEPTMTAYANELTKGIAEGIKRG